MWEKIEEFISDVIMLWPLWLLFGITIGFIVRYGV
jgi:hypothetical protein